MQITNYIFVILVHTYLQNDANLNFSPIRDILLDLSEIYEREFEFPFFFVHKKFVLKDKMIHYVYRETHSQSI